MINTIYLFIYFIRILNLNCLCTRESLLFTALPLCLFSDMIQVKTLKKTVAYLLETSLYKTWQATTLLAPRVRQVSIGLTDRTGQLTPFRTAPLTDKGSDSPVYLPDEEI